MKILTFPFIRTIVYFADTNEAIAKLKKTTSGVPIRRSNANGLATRHIEDGQIICTIQLDPTLQNKKQYINIATHEISHVVTFIMGHHKFDDDELRSCLVGHLSEEFLN